MDKFPQVKGKPLFAGAGMVYFYNDTCGVGTSYGRAPVFDFFIIIIGSASCCNNSGRKLIFFCYLLFATCLQLCSTVLDVVVDLFFIQDRGQALYNVMADSTCQALWMM